MKGREAWMDTRENRTDFLVEELAAGGALDPNQHAALLGDPEAMDRFTDLAMGTNDPMALVLGAQMLAGGLQDRGTYGPLLASGSHIATDAALGLDGGGAAGNDAVAAVEGSAGTGAAESRSVTVGEGDSFWRIAARDLGEGATDAQIQQRTQELMEANPGVDPRALRAGDQLQVPPGGFEVSGDTVEAFARDAALGGAVSRGVNVDPLAQEYGKIHQAIDDVMRNDALSDEQKRASVGAIVQSASHYTANVPEADRVRGSQMLAGVALNADWRTRDLGATSAGIGSDEGLPQMAGSRGMQLQDPDGTLWEHNGNTWRQVSGNERTVQSRRVGDTIHHVQTSGTCPPISSECHIRQANIDYSAPENAGYVKALNSKAMSDAATGLSLIAFRYPLAVSGKIAFGASDGLNVANAIYTEDPAKVIGTAYGQAAKFRADTMGVSSSTAVRASIIVNESTQRLHDYLKDQ